jgi:ketosteroid isomerase-like protein
MTVFRFSRLLLTVFIPLLASGACSPHTVDLAAEERALLQRDAEWADIASAGKDVDRILSYFADDALMIEPGAPVFEGKAAIRAYVTTSLRTPGFKIHWVSEKPVFSPDGNMAYMRGVDDTTVPGPTGALMTVHWRGVSIWRRDPATREWLCVVDIANEPPSPARAASAPAAGSD